MDWKVHNDMLWVVSGSRRQKPVSKGAFLDML